MTPTSTPENFTESGLQAACHTWFHNEHPQYRGLGFMIHNDGAKHAIQAAQDKARGLVPGIPDWCLAVPAATAHGLYVEFKVGRNTCDKAQVLAIERLKAQGYRVEVVRRLDDFKRLITDYLT